MANLNNTKDRDLKTKFDRSKKPLKFRFYLKPIAWILAFTAFVFRKQTLKKVNMKGVKPPYILLCNHNAFMDFKVAVKATFPHIGINIVAIDGFIKREGLLRRAGCIGKRKFTSDILLVKHIRYALKTLKQIVLIYPEARYSLVGTASPIPESLSKLIKKMVVQVVVLKTFGHHVDSPVWHLRPRKNRIEATMTKILDIQDLEAMDVAAIHHIIENAFAYDDFKWQADNKVHTRYKQRAEGLHKMLYQCPSCKTEFKMRSKDDLLFCDVCMKTYQLNTLNRIHALEGSTEFTHIPDWFEWQRANVKKEIEAGTYHIEGIVDVDALPNSKGFINLGEGTLVHNMEGFTLTYDLDGKKEVLHKDVPSQFGCHVEYNYNNKGDCVSISTLDDTFYMYFKTLENIITKVHFATEERYKHYVQNSNNSK